MRGKLILISGPSGVGKGTIRKDIGFDDYVFSISSTTRTIREGEEHGVHYFYISRDEFEAKVSNGDMLESAEFASNLYGTDRNVVEALLDQGKNVLLEIECQGAIQVIDQMPDVISIFILPPSLKELETRLRGRGTESDDVINLRLKKAREEILYKDLYKHYVINDNLEHSSRELDRILTKEFDVLV